MWRPRVLGLTVLLVGCQSLTVRHRPNRHTEHEKIPNAQEAAKSVQHDELWAENVMHGARRAHRRQGIDALPSTRAIQGEKGGTSLEDQHKLHRSIEMRRKAMIAKAKKLRDEHVAQANAAETEQLEVELDAEGETHTPDGRMHWNNLEARIMDAIIHIKSGEPEKALYPLAGAVDAPKPNPTALALYSGCLIALGRFAEARPVLQTSIEIAPSHMPALMSMGLVHMRMVQMDESEHYYREALKLLPQNEHALNGLGSVAAARAVNIEHEAQTAGTLEQKKPVIDKLRHEALGHFNKAVKYNPYHYHSFINMAATQSDLQHVDEAIHTYNHVLELNPVYPSAFYARGLVYAHHDREKEALYSYTQAVRIDPLMYDAYYARGVLQTAMNRTSHAKESFKLAFAINPEHPRIDEHPDWELD